MKKKTIELVVPIMIKYETAKDLQDAISEAKRSVKLRVWSAGVTNFEYESKRPRLLYYRGRLNL